MKKIALVIVIFASVIACKTAKTPSEVKVEKSIDCSTMNVTYTADIKPIFDKYCNSCHGNGGVGGYDFTSYKNIMRAANNGELLGTIKWERGFPKMPEDADKLDKATIAKIECWINNGMKQ